MLGKRKLEDGWLVGGQPELQPHPPILTPTHIGIKIQSIQLFILAHCSCLPGILQVFYVLLLKPLCLRQHKLFNISQASD